MPLGLILAGALAIGLLAVLTGATSKDAGAQACSGQFTLDFGGLPAGTIIGEQYAASGVHISGEGHNNGPDALIVFDSNSTDTDLDVDLRVGIGNIAIFANNLDDGNGDGLIDRPDENNYGGRAVFAFDQAVSIGSFKFVDKDHEPDDFAIAYDASDNVIKQAAISPAGNGSVQTIAINADGVRRFEVVYGDSGGFTGIEVDCGQPGATPTPTAAPATPSPTSPPDTPSPEAATPTPTGRPGLRHQRQRRPQRRQQLRPSSRHPPASRRKGSPWLRRPPRARKPPSWEQKLCRRAAQRRHPAVHSSGR